MKPLRTIRPFITQVRVKVLNLDEAHKKKQEDEASKKDNKLANQLAKRKEQARKQRMENEESSVKLDEMF